MPVNETKPDALQMPGGEISPSDQEICSNEEGLLIVEPSVLFNKNELDYATRAHERQSLQDEATINTQYVNWWYIKKKAVG